MKITMIGQKGIPTLFGGIERHVEEISCHLAKKNDNQVFVYARNYYTPKRIKKYKKVNIIHLPLLRTKHLDAISHVFLSSWHAIFKIKPDVIHYHGVGPALCIWIPKIFSPKTKVIFTFHCRDYFHKKWGGFAQLSLKLGEIIGCYLADEIIPVSLELEKYIEKKYNKKTSFIPHGIKKEKCVSDEYIKKWGLEKNNYILAVSRLIRHKGLHYLIKAYEGIKTDKKLVIVGPSFHTEDYEKELKELSKNNPNIIFLGTQQGEILKSLYSNAYVFVNPSEQEGLPLTVLESASFGIPLLLSDIDIHRKMLNNLSFLFKDKDIASLKKNLKFILDNPQIALNKAKEIKSYAWRNYNWDSVVEKIVLKYD